MPATLDALQKGLNAQYVAGDLIAYVGGENIVIARLVGGTPVLTVEGQEMLDKHNPLDRDWDDAPGGSQKGEKRSRKAKAGEQAMAGHPESVVKADEEPVVEEPVVEEPVVEEPAEVQLDLNDFLSTEDKMG